MPTVTKPRASGEALSKGAAGTKPRAVMSTPLKPPPPYCTERPFQATGRLIWKLMSGALGSSGAMCPSTLQYSGAAGVMVAAGVGPRSTVLRGLAATKVALTRVATPLGMPMAEAAMLEPASAAQPVFTSRKGAGPGVPQPCNKAAVATVVASKSGGRKAVISVSPRANKGASGCRPKVCVAAQHWAQCGG